MANTVIITSKSVAEKRASNYCNIIDRDSTGGGVQAPEGWVVIEITVRISFGTNWKDQ